MPASMGTALLTTTARLVLASWRGQLALLGAGVLVLGALLHGVTDGGLVAARIVASLLVGVVIAFASATVAAAGRAPLRATLDPALVARRVQRLLVQVMAAAMPAAVAVVLALSGANIHPLVGLLMLPIAFAACAACASLVLLAIAAVADGHDRWLPISAWRTFRGSPWRLTGVVVAGGVAASVVVLPFVLTGLVVMAIGSLLGPLGTGLAAGAVLPLIGSSAIAVWRASGVDPVPAAPSVIAGPSWVVRLEAGGAWGTWVRLDRATDLQVRVEWTGVPGPDLAVADEAGRWRRPPAPAASGDRVVVNVPAGNSYLHLGSTGTDVQNCRVSLLVEVAEAA